MHDSWRASMFLCKGSLTANAKKSEEDRLPGSPRFGVLDLNLRLGRRRRRNLTHAGGHTRQLGQHIVLG